jgi:hypothetical protein
MLNLNYLFLISFTLILIIDSIIRSKIFSSKLKKYYYQFIKLSSLSLFFLIFSFILFILVIFNLFDINLVLNLNDNFYNIKNHMENIDNNITNSPVNNNNNLNINTKVLGEIKDGTVNLNTPSFKINMPIQGINNLAAAASSAGGASLAIKMAKQLPGSPAAKVAVGLGVMGTVQATTAIMSKVLNKNNSNNNNNLSNNFIDNIFTNSNSNDINNIYSDFPLNLLPEINNLVNLEILFLSILFNLYLVNILTKFNYNKYVPKNKLGKIFDYLISRYITIWSKSKMILFIISWICLFICVILSKICLYYILNT